MNINMAEQNAEQQHVLLQFLDNIHRKTLFQQNEEHIKSLEMGVKEIIQKIIDVFYSNGKYDFEDMIHVGSSYEGSKIISPDEFDFMLVLKHLSQPGKLYIDEGCQPGMKLLRHKKFERSESSGPNLVFNNVLGLEIDSIMTSSDAQQDKQKTIRIKTLLGELQIKNIFRYTLHLECVNDDGHFDIKVDLMPSVRIPCDTKEVKKDMIFCPSEIRQLAFKDGCFLVGKFCVVDGMCWQLSFAAAERNMMKSLSSGHMKIYRVLKYIFVEKSIVGICDLMSSYVLKTAVLRHAYFQCEEKAKPTGCFVAILRSIATSMGSASMKSLFVPSLNLWQRVIQEKMRNITENDTICSRSVRDQLSRIITAEGNELKDALTVTVVFDFWKRVFLLLADIFDSTEYGSLTKTLLEHCLHSFYTQLNEEDEEDDIDKDYFKQENTGKKALNENDHWKVFRSSANLEKADSKTKHCTSVLNENVFENAKGSEHIDFIVDDADENDKTCEDQAQDLEDIEAFVNTYVEKNGETFDSEDESYTEDDEFCCEEEDSGDELYVQAEQEDVYQIYEKYQADINAVDIPVFTQLLEQISKSASCRSIQCIVDNLRAGPDESDPNEHIGGLKKRKISND